MDALQGQLVFDSDGKATPAYSVLHHDTKNDVYFTPRYYSVLSDLLALAKGIRERSDSILIFCRITHHSPFRTAKNCRLT